MECLLLVLFIHAHLFIYPKTILNLDFCFVAGLIKYVCISVFYIICKLPDVDHKQQKVLSLSECQSKKQQLYNSIQKRKSNDKK